DDQVARPPSRVLDTAGDLGEVRIDHVAHQHADDSGAPRNQRASQRRGRVAQLARGGLDAPAGVCCDRIVDVVQDARGGRNRYASPLRDVLDTRHSAGYSLTAPAAMPAMNCFCVSRNAITTGMVETT